MQKGIKFRIYPNKEQKNFINQTLGCCRLIYNKGLAMRKEAYQNGNKIGYSQTSAMLTELKKQDDFSFLKTVDSIALQQSLRDLDRSFVNFFQKRAGYPRFKSKHNHYQSYRTLNQGDKIRIVGKYLKLPKMGYVRVRQSMEVGNIKNVTIEHTPTGKYFAVLNVEFEPVPLQNHGCSIGIDVGIRNFYTDSNGNKVSNPRQYEKALRELVREQRSLSRKVKGSNNWKKQRIRVALVHEKVANQRNDFLQKVSTELIRENQTICIEDLSVKEIIQGVKGSAFAHKMARYVYAASWNKFFNMLVYKAQWYGCEIRKVPKDYPSSQICSCCGYQNPLVRNMAIHHWICPECKTKHDRDINASINILREGLSMSA